MRISSKNALPLICVAALTTSAHAQQETDSSSSATRRMGALEEIVVTAQRRAESINEVGMAIQAIDAPASKHCGSPACAT